MSSMKTRRAQNKQQLELVLEAVKSFEGVIQSFTKTMTLLMDEQQGIPFDEPTKPQKASPRRLSEERKRLVKAIKTVAMTKRLKVREIYILMFDRLYEETGFNAVSYGIAKGKKTYLDGIEQKGYLKKAIKIIANF